MFPFLEKYTKVINETSELSMLSKKAYTQRFRLLTEKTGKDMNQVIGHFVTTYNIIKHYPLETQKCYITAILAIFKYSKNYRQKYNKAYQQWLALFLKISHEAQQKYENMEQSERQKASYVEWKDVLSARDNMPDKKSQDYLLLCLYTMIPPSRADMNQVKIYYDKEPKDISVYPNYLVINTKNNTMRLVYNEFKSKTKKNDKYDKELPQELVDVIKSSLEYNKRDFLIASRLSKKPYTPKSFATHFSRILFKLFNKNVTINTLRHSFINSLDLNKLTPAKKTTIARDMMHSPATMDRYRFNIEE